MTRLALFALFLLVPACGLNRSSAGVASPANSRAPILVVENGTGNAYEVYIITAGVDRGRMLGTVASLEDTQLPLVDVPLDGSVRFRARPVGASIGDQYSEYDRDIVSDPVEIAGERKVTWILHQGSTQIKFAARP